MMFIILDTYDHGDVLPSNTLTHNRHVADLNTYIHLAKYIIYLFLQMSQ